jgi:hypothetical protein
MAKFIRYLLATVCFAASVGCLALWGWSHFSTRPATVAEYALAKDELSLTAFAGTGVIIVVSPTATLRESFVEWMVRDSNFGMFGQFGRSVYFPLWYPALVFALAGVAALRFRRQFSIRSALITVSVVAALLGMVVAL